MIKLVYERPEAHAEYTAVKSVEMVIDDERSLNDMLQAYKDFLSGIGFFIPLEDEETRE